MVMAKVAARRPPLDLPERNFTTLGGAELARLGVVLRPLVWIDGLLTAMVVSPADEEPEGWSDHMWNDDELGNLTMKQVDDVMSVVVDHMTHLFAMLYERPDAYSPYFAGAGGDRLEAAAQWAAGFRFGIQLLPEPWAPLIDDEDARMLLAVIFSLERDEDLPEEARADSPFRDITADRREEMRRAAVGMLPDAVRALHELSFSLDEGEADEFGGAPYVRPTPKTGRNEPCPCGSGRKHKKCCLNDSE